MGHEELREFIQTRRLKAGMSLQDMSEKCHLKLSKQAIGQYLKGGGIGDKNLDALLRIFGYELHHKKLVKKK